jgi:hypothetical protein
MLSVARRTRGVQPDHRLDLAEADLERSPPDEAAAGPTDAAGDEPARGA